MFGEVVRRPLRREEFEDLWQNLGDPDVLRRVRRNVLERGSTDFDNPYCGASPVDDATPVCYSPAQKVLLYCAVYMPMHLYSSYHVYRRFLEPPEGKVLFIDFGCGPLTSGIAYRDFARHADISYIGIDRSKAMLDMARAIDHPSRFSQRMLLDNFNRLTHCIDNFITENQTIIFNFSYILAIKTLGGSRRSNRRELNRRELNSLTNALSRVMERYREHPMRVVYQNPKGFLSNWNRLKSRLPYEFKSSRLNVQRFSYPRLTTGEIREGAPVECETLYKPLI